MVSRTDFGFYLKTSRGIIKPKKYDCIVNLLPGETFTLITENNSSFKTKAKFILSGENIGTLVIPPHRTSEVKRPLQGIDRQFKYVEFDSNNALTGKLDKNKLHCDEVTVIFSVEKKTYSNNSLHDSVRDASVTDGLEFECAHSSFKGSDIPKPRGICVETDSIGPSRGGVVLGPNMTHQSFSEVADFETIGEFSFTILMRSLDPVKLPSIISLSDMKKYN